MTTAFSLPPGVDATRVDALRVTLHETYAGRLDPPLVDKCLYDGVAAAHLFELLDEPDVIRLVEVSVREVIDAHLDGRKAPARIMPITRRSRDADAD